MEKDADVIGKYRNISNKLKKKFLRKPNVAEGSEQFGALARSLKAQESHQYAAFCCLAQASDLNTDAQLTVKPCEENQILRRATTERMTVAFDRWCEHTLANASGEAQCLLEAARNFLEAETNSQYLKCPGFQEHLDAAINCYSHAIRVHVENKQPALAAALCLEVGNALKKRNKCSEAIPHFQRAAELQSFSILDCLSALGLVASSKLEIKDFEGALSVFTEMSGMVQKNGGMTGGSKPLGAYSDILARCEVTRVLLLMYLQPTPQRIRPEHAKTLEHYTWDSNGETSPTQYLEEDMFLLLQSVVMACQSKDTEALKSLQIELWPRFSAEQNQLLHLVIDAIERPPGEGF